METDQVGSFSQFLAGAIEPSSDAFQRWVEVAKQLDSLRMERYLAWAELHPVEEEVYSRLFDQQFRLTRFVQDMAADHMDSTRVAETQLGLIRGLVNDLSSALQPIIDRFKRWRTRVPQKINNDCKYIIAHRFNYKCPGGCDVTILNAATMEWLPIMEFDHFYGTGHNTWDAIWPLDKENCHAKKTYAFKVMSYYELEELKAAHTNYIRRIVSDYSCRIVVGISEPTLPEQRSLF